MVRSSVAEPEPRFITWSQSRFKIVSEPLPQVLVIVIVIVILILIVILIYKKTAQAPAKKGGSGNPGTMYM